MKLIDSLKKYGVKGFFSRWKDAMYRLPPEDLIQARIISYIGMTAGIIIGIVMLFLQGYWYLSLALGFTLAIQITNFISDLQNYRMLKSLKPKEINMNMEEIK